ncbi:hypothetical protein CRM22_011301 [Opisthorchis felineus]|uniref:Uncharacterized protein n=1 Tax=Opisthorchis felineus TaxID=147828 RepID=A0A4S2JPU0_OPIFE|nr:hypothetical protein CRM22_011301 [Opisthorchis felineus]
MPRGKKKILHPPLTFLHPPFSKPLSEVVRVASSDQYPAVKTASTEEKCTWINPDFSLSTRSFFPKGGRRPPVQRNSPKPPLEFIEDPLDQVMTKSLSLGDKCSSKRHLSTSDETLRTFLL